MIIRQTNKKRYQFNRFSFVKLKVKACHHRTDFFDDFERFENVN